MLNARKYGVVVRSEMVPIHLEVAAHAAHTADIGLEGAEACEGPVDKTAGIAAHHAVEVSERNDANGGDVESFN